MYQTPPPPFGYNVDLSTAGLALHRNSQDSSRINLAYVLSANDVSDKESGDDWSVCAQYPVILMNAESVLRK